MGEYFSHDYHARNDQKLETLLMKEGLAGLGLYWCIVEMLYEDKGYIMLSQCERIAYALRTQEDIVKRIVTGELFKNDGVRFWSTSVLNRLKMRAEKSHKAMASAKIRWNANAMRTQCDGNAIKVKKSKGKEKKENENKENTNTTPSAVETVCNEEKFVFLKDTRFFAEFASFKQHRVDIKKKLNSHAERLILEKLHKHDMATAILMIQQSIENGWSGVFPIKNQNGGTYGKFITRAETTNDNKAALDALSRKI